MKDSNIGMYIRSTSDIIPNKEYIRISSDINELYKIPNLKKEKDI